MCTVILPPYPVVTTVASSVYVRMTYAYMCVYVLYIGVLKMMQARIETLRSTLDRVTARVSEPHAKIVSRTRQLSRLQVRTYVASVGCTTSSALYCITSSYALYCTTSSYALYCTTSSYALYCTTSSYALYCTTSSYALYCTTSSALCVCTCSSCVVHFIHLCSLRVTYCARSFECCTS